MSLTENLFNQQLENKLGNKLDLRHYSNIFENLFLSSSFFLVSFRRTVLDRLSFKTSDFKIFFYCFYTDEI